MSEEFDAVTDNAATPLDSEPSVITDEDRLDADPLEDGMDTAEDYSRTMRLGGTAEAEEQETLAYRIPQEEPDPVLEELDRAPGRPVADTPVDDLDESIDEPDPVLDGVPERAAVDPLSPDGATEAERDGEVELGLDPAVGSNEATGLPADDSIGAVARVDREVGTEGAEQEALRIEQES